MKDMLKFAGGVALLGLVSGTAGAGTFVQRFEAAYATPEAAKRATVSAADLPPGKAFSFSMRWDDANPRHLNMADTLDPLGMKATFYINGYVRKFVPVMTNLIARGHSLGDHSISHDFMQFLSPVAMFREIMDCRILIETDAQTPVSAFSIPYGTLAMTTDPDATRRYGVALANSGLLGSAQGGRDIAATLGLDSSRWIGTPYFSINDNDPDEKRFRSGMDIVTNAAINAKDVAGPHVTMGTHTWQTDEGLVKLSGILSSIAHRPDIWFVNENEWIASRVQALAAKFRTVSVKGKRVVYEVTRPEPSDIGAAMPLYLAFSEPPVSVRLAGAAKVDVLKDGLPVGEPHGLPQAYRKLGEGTLTVDEALKRFTCTFRNDSPADWQGGEATLRLPPGFAPGTVVRRVGPVRAGQEKTVTFESARTKDALPIEGDFYAAVQIDVRGRSGAERLWATCVKKRTAPPAAVPRDTCTVAGPYDAEKDPGAEFFAGLSRPGAALADFAGADGAWRTAERNLKHHPSVVSTARPGWRAPDRKPRFLAFAYELEADVAAHGDKWKMNLGIQSLAPEKERVFLNGKAVPRTEPLTLEKGRNRLIVVQDFTHHYNFLHEIAVVSEKDGACADFRSVR